jgi:fucose permease
MTVLLIIIYAAFISLGLPDSLLGSAWPVMRAGFDAPVAVAGYLSMTICIGTIISSFLSSRILARFSTGTVTAVSVAMTAAALYGFSFAPSVWFMFLMAIPLGLGAGSVDASLNNFVALHYESRHMNWLHCFWGIGATVGPMIMAFNIDAGNGWRAGYLIVAIIQSALVIVLFATLGLWKNGTVGSTAEQTGTRFISNREAIRLPYAKLAMLGFIFFSATETTTGLWASSYLTGCRGFSAADAATVTSCFYGGITAGRLIAGFISIKAKSSDLIRWGQLICVAGALCILLPLPAGFAVAGIIMIGLGTAPVFPAMLHETPNRFGKDISQALVGIEMGTAYIGSLIAPMVLGQLVPLTGMGLYPYYILVCILIMLVSSEMLQSRIAKKHQSGQ